MNVDARDLHNLIRTLDAYPPAVRNKPIRIALNAAGGICKRELEARAPRKAGYLAKSQAVKVTRKRSGDWQMTAGPNRKKTFVKKVATGHSIKGFKPNKAGVFVQRTRNVKAAHTVKPSRYSHLAGPRRQAVYVRAAAIASSPAATAKAVSKLRQELAKKLA